MSRESFINSKKMDLAIGVGATGSLLVSLGGVLRVTDIVTNQAIPIMEPLRGMNLEQAEGAALLGLLVGLGLHNIFHRRLVKHLERMEALKAQSDKTPKLDLEAM